MTKAFETVKKIMGDDADILIIAHKDGEYSLAIHGDQDELAQGYFALMHSNDDIKRPILYHILKLNVLNIFGNESPFAINLMRAIRNVIPEENE